MPRLQPKAPHLTPLLGSGSPLGFRAPHPRTRHSSASAQPISGQDTASHFSASVQLHFASGTPRLHNSTRHLSPRLQRRSSHVTSCHSSASAHIHSNQISAAIHPTPPRPSASRPQHSASVHDSPPRLTPRLQRRSSHVIPRLQLRTLPFTPPLGFTPPHAMSRLHRRALHHNPRLQHKSIRIMPRLRSISLHITSRLQHIPLHIGSPLGSTSLQTTAILGFSSDDSISLHISSRPPHIASRLHCSSFQGTPWLHNSTRHLSPRLHVNTAPSCHISASARSISAESTSRLRHDPARDRPPLGFTTTHP
ncbi:hypothetical protein LCGC14_2689420, partial [marine sediment metagenome]